MKRFKGFLFILAICLLFSSFAAIAADTGGAVIQYATPPGSVASTEYTIKVNGESIFTEHILNESIARFAIDGQVNVEITVPEEVESFDISPHSEKIQGYVSGNKLSFTLSRPRKLIVTINQFEKLFIFADSPETDAPVLGDENVYNIMDYNISLEDGVSNGPQIQAAINEVSKKPNGGVLYFPNGKYETHNLEIGSNVHIYLEPGAILKATADKNSYPSNHQHFIRFLHAENSKITGRGIIDAGSRYISRYIGDPPYINMFGLIIYGSKNILIDGVILRDPFQWNTTILHSEHVTLNNYKVINNIQRLYTDGIDTVGSNNVLINDCFVYSGDDSFTVKNLPLTHNFFTRNHRTDDEIVHRDSHDITIQNNVCWTLTSALKVGTETYADRVYNITVDNNDVVLTKRGMVLWVRDGTIVSDVKFSNNRFESTGQGNLGSLIYFVLSERDAESKSGAIKDIVFKDNMAETHGLFMSSIENLLVRGGAEENISNVSIENLMIGGKYITNTDELRLSTFGEVKNITFKVNEKANADGSINLRINGRYFNFDQPPVLLDSRVLVPLRGIFEAIDAVVEWDASANKITVTHGDKIITMIVGNANTTVNGQEVTLDVPPQVINGRTLVPIRFIAETLGAEVEWIDDLKLVSAEGIETVADKQDDTYFEDNFENYVGSASTYIPPKNFWTLGNFVVDKAYTVGEKVEGGTGNSLKLVMNGSDKRLSFYKEFLPIRYDKDTIVETRLMFKNTDAHTVGPELRTSNKVGSTFQRALNFYEGGIIYVGDKPAGNYEAGVWYNIKVYVKISEVNGAPKTSFIVFIDDEKVGEMDIEDPTGYMDGVRYFIESHEDAALYFDYVKIYQAEDGMLDIEAPISQASPVSLSFSENFDDFEGSKTERLMPSGWGATGGFAANSAYVLASNAPGSNDQSLRMVMDGGPNNFFVSWNSLPTFTSDAVVEFRAMADSLDADIALPQLKLSSREGGTFITTFGFDTDGNIYAPGERISQMEYQPNKWYDVRVEVKLETENNQPKTTLTTYVDGELVGSYNVPSATGNMSGLRLKIGKQGSGSAYIDDLKVYTLD